MDPGDLLLIRPEALVPVDSRYASGLVLEAYVSTADLRCVRVLWRDGYLSQEVCKRMSPYYEVVKHGTG